MTDLSSVMHEDVRRYRESTTPTLLTVPTAELVAELATRDEVEYRWRLKGRDERWPDKHAIPVCGPCKILVVRE